MKVIRLKKLAYCLWMLLFVGCSPLYPNPEIEGQISFVGARQLAKESGSNRVRMIFTHGMCSHSHEGIYQLDRYNRWKNVVGAKETAVLPRQQTITGSVGKAEFPVLSYLEDTIIGSDNTAYEVSFVYWGKLMEAHQQALEYDNYRAGGEDPSNGSDPYRPRRAALNHDFLKKELMNKCLLDVVVYSGPQGDPIRKAMREYVCKFMGGHPVNGSDPKGRVGTKLTCLTGEATSERPPLVLVPESLGAKILFDAYRDIKFSKGRQTLSETAKAKAFGPLGGVHLITNQIPLLDQGNVGQSPSEPKVPGTTCRNGEFTNRKGTFCRSERPSGSSLLDFLSSMSTNNGVALEQSNNAPVPIVAYTDPNDIFGYRLNDKILPPAKDNSNGETTTKFQVVNVLLSNAGTFLGLFANPVKTHSGAKDQDEIFEMILNGVE